MCGRISRSMCTTTMSSAWKLLVTHTFCVFARRLRRNSLASPARTSTSDAQSVVIVTISSRKRSEALQFIENIVGLIEGKLSGSGLHSLHSGESDGLICVALDEHDRAKT